jgi:hypothetical protein
LEKVNKKRTVTVRRLIIFLNISRCPFLSCLQCCLHQYKTMKAVATTTAAIVLLTPAKNLKKVFLGFLVVSPLFNHFRIGLNISEGDLAEKNWFQNLLEALNCRYFGDFLNFGGQKNSPGKYCHKRALKLYFFGKT